MSILKKLKISAELKQKRNELEGLRAKEGEFKRRYSQLETAIDEAGTDEEIELVRAEIEALTAEEDEAGLSGKISEVENDISRLEGEFEAENAAPAAPEPENKGEGEERSLLMNKFQARKLFETGEYYERAEVLQFYDDLKNLKTRAVSGAGLTIPEVVFNRITEIMGDYTTLYPLVDKIRVKGEARILLDTDTTAATWMEMSSAIPDGDVGTITDISFDGFKVGKVVFVDNYLLQDSIINLDDYVTRKIARAIALALDAAILNGRGSTYKEPTGIIPSLDATHKVNVEKGAKTLIDTVKQISLIDTGEDVTGDIVAVMKRSTYYGIFFEYSVQVNSSGNVVGKLPNLTRPDLIGIPIVFSNHIAADKVLFGEFDKYTLVERENLTIDRSEHYKFKEDQMSFRGKGRYDGKPVKPAAFVLVSLVDPSNELTTDDTTEETTTYTDEELEAMTKDQLLALAEEMEVTGVSSSNTKAEIIAAIKAAQ